LALVNSRLDLIPVRFGSGHLDPVRIES